MTNDEARLRFITLLSKSPKSYEDLRQAFKNMAYTDGDFVKAYKYASTDGLVERTGTTVTLTRKAVEEEESAL